MNTVSSNDVNGNIPPLEKHMSALTSRSTGETVEDTSEQNPEAVFKTPAAALKRGRKPQPYVCLPIHY